MSQVKVNQIIRKLYVEHDNKLIEVKQIDDASDYAKTVTVYTKELVKGAKKGDTTYAVAVEDFIPKKRTSVKGTIDNLLASGMTAQEILQKLQGL